MSILLILCGTLAVTPSSSSSLSLSLPFFPLVAYFSSSSSLPASSSSAAAFLAMLSSFLSFWAFSNSSSSPDSSSSSDCLAWAKWAGWAILATLAILCWIGWNVHLLFVLGSFATGLCLPTRFWIWLSCSSSRIFLCLASLRSSGILDSAYPQVDWSSWCFFLLCVCGKKCYPEGL